MVNDKGSLERKVKGSYLLKRKNVTIRTLSRYTHSDLPPVPPILRS